MPVPYFELFMWWVIAISWSIVFLSLVAIYLYIDSRKRRSENSQTIIHAADLLKDFVFVWVLFSLLVLYVISINIGSSTLFAAGNIVVEIILMAYILKKKTRESK